jgi:hypothetical protein
MADQVVGYTVIPTYLVTNVSPQIIKVNINKSPTTSPIYTKYGATQLAPGAKVEAEQTRFDLAQLKNMANNSKVITYEALKRKVDIIGPGGGSSGSTGA